MDQELREMLEENNRLLQENLELTKQNTKKIKRILSFMRRSFIAKIMYWLIIILVTAGALYAVKPYIEDVVETYNTVQDQLETTSGIIDNPSSLFKDVKILNSFFGS